MHHVVNHLFHGHTSSFISDRGLWQKLQWNIETVCYLVTARSLKWRMPLFSCLSAVSETSPSTQQRGCCCLQRTWRVVWDLNKYLHTVKQIYPRTRCGDGHSPLRPDWICGLSCSLQLSSGFQLMRCTHIHSKEEEEEKKNVSKGIYLDKACGDVQ